MVGEVVPYRLWGITSPARRQKRNMSMGTEKLGMTMRGEAADLIILYAPNEQAAWAVKNRYGFTFSDQPQGTDLEGSRLLFVDISSGRVEVGIHRTREEQNEVD